MLTTEQMLADTKPPFPALSLFLSLTTLICCGGYAFGLLFWMTGWISAALVVSQGTVSFFKIRQWIQEDDGRSGFAKAFLVALIIAVALLTCILAVLNVWFPRTVAGITSVINLMALIYAFYHSRDSGLT